MSVWLANFLYALFSLVNRSLTQLICNASNRFLFRIIHYVIINHYQYSDIPEH